MPNPNQPAETQRPVRDRIPPMAILLAGSVAVLGSNSLVLAPIAPEVAGSLATSVAAVMTAAAAFGIGTAASALLVARHIDRIGARRMLQAAFIVLSVALGLCAAAPAVIALVAAQLVAGLATGIAIPSIYTLAAVVAPRGRESETIGVVLTGWTLSMVAGVSLSALLADLVHWRAVYIVVALLAVAAAIALSFSGYRDAPASGAAPAPLGALKIPGVAPLLVACGVFMTAFYGTYGYLGDHLANGLGLPVSANGLAAFAYGAGFGAAAFLDRLIDCLGARRALPAAFVAAAFAYVALALAGGNYKALLACVFAWGLFNHFALNALVMRLTAIDPDRRGAIMGLNTAVTYVAVFTGTIGFGPIYTAFGFAALPSLAVALLLVAAACSGLAPSAARSTAFANAERPCTDE